MKRLVCLTIVACLLAVLLAARAEGGLELISGDELPPAHQQAVELEMERARQEKRSTQRIHQLLRGAPSGYADVRSDGDLKVSYTISAARVVVGQKVTFSVDISCEETPMYITYSGLIMDDSFRETGEISAKNYRSPYKTASASWSYTPTSPGHFCFVLVVSDSAGNRVAFHTNTIQAVKISDDPEYTSKAVDGSMTAIVAMDKKEVKVGETITAQVAFVYDVDPIRYTGSWKHYDDQDQETVLATFKDVVLTGGDTVLSYPFTPDLPGEIVLQLEAEDGEDNRVLFYTPGIEVKPSRLPGDADDSGVVDLADAITLLQYTADGNCAINASNADVNVDGRADIHDALLIMQYLAGWNVTMK